MKPSLFYHKKPMFGLDIGSQTVKHMQLVVHPKRATVQAYGSVATDEKIIRNGVVANVARAAKLIDTLLSDHTVGRLTTNRVVMSIPVAHIFTRVLALPVMTKKELDSAMRLEVEQSVPMPTKNLYFDYEITDIGDPQTVLVRLVAAPREIVDSYVAVCDLLKLDLALVQTNIQADVELCVRYEALETGQPYIIVDVGGNSIDVGVLDNTLRLTGTVDEGGNSLTEAIARTMKISAAKANQLKVSQGISAGANQKKLESAVLPILDKVVHETKRMIRFYEERVKEGSEISQILIVGGGANMPGLGDYLTNATHIPTRVSAPWGKHIAFGKLEPPELADLPRFLTCAGLALTEESEVFGL